MYKYNNGIKIKMTAEEVSEMENFYKQFANNNTSIEKNNNKEAPYIDQRKNAYPPIGDQLDMLWHTIDKDITLQKRYFEFYQAIQSVKVKYPK